MVPLRRFGVIKRMPTYVRGEFQGFIATRSFALGNYRGRVYEGDVVYFDGSEVCRWPRTLKATAEWRTFPHLAAAVTVGWLVATGESLNYSEMRLLAPVTPPVPKALPSPTKNLWQHLREG
jgi:hypothetical protein